jgi:hypothetical protein
VAAEPGDSSPTFAITPRLRINAVSGMVSSSASHTMGRPSNSVGTISRVSL